MKTIKKIFRLILKVIKWGFFSITALAVISALYNLSLPDKSKVVEHLSCEEKGFIAETLNLHRNLGNEVWPGWGNLPIPVIVYNEKYAFLIGISDPTPGWYKMPTGEHRGSDWEMVKTDKLNGKPYHRQALPNPDITPENFTVKVGDNWVATMQTKEYAALQFYSGFKNELPPLLNVIFPYKIFWHILMGKPETNIGGMAHEAFHAFQGNEVYEKFAACENTNRLSADYPWDDAVNATGWMKETNLLLEAYTATSKETAKQLLAQFIDKRKERRINANLPVEMIQYEQKREWIEGLAKYAELEIGLLAQEKQDYFPIDEFKKKSGFKNYKTQSKYVSRQIAEVKRAANRPGESRFYYGGMLQAVILDRLMPGWKKKAFDNQVYLDGLLQKAI
ncbi:hypothetical protein SAMN06265379_11532 [Saccharicrinis carchari]|uniref:Uncharacterized protein n=1 Tax=Saccharicrinis carchari TaxID=1168039 RepID=A0A521F6S6_SACCC|nr:hypothetical protein [Saccharicrinis carchari]SMO91918.1 hypothetical protein SAMN06265379_11532 [Saccharicrinis carchari]